MRISGKVFYHLMLLKKDIYITLESLANYTFIVAYKGLYSPLDRSVLVGAIAIPMLYKQVEVQRKISEMIAVVFTIYVVIFIIVLIIGIILAHQISRPLAKLIKGIHRVSAGELDFKIPSKSNDEFGELVKAFNAMTKDLKVSRSKLVQAEKDAAWREMARQIAHEIKNPLTPMKLSAQHINRAYKDKAVHFDKIMQKGITTIIDAIDSLSKTASSFSEFAKFIKPILGKYSIYPTLEECINLFEHYKEQNIFIASAYDEDLPKVKIDPDQLKRVIINLLTNAVQAMKSDTGRILMTCKCDPEDDDMILISIKDNGFGIPDSVKPHLFEPNFSTKSYGSGLGLAICKRAIDQMGGDITIESEEGKGTSVTVYIPVYK